MRVKPNTRFGRIESDLKARSSSNQIKRQALSLADDFIKAELKSLAKHLASQGMLKSKSFEDKKYYEGLVAGVKQSSSVVSAKFQTMIEEILDSEEEQKYGRNK